MAEKYYSKIEDVHLPPGKYVLVLPGWYPTWQDEYLGDFNQRHVLAAGLQTPQVVLYIVKDQSKKLTQVETKYRQVTEKVIEIIVMYPGRKIAWLDAIHSNLLYLRSLYKHAKNIRKRWGKPLLLHAYIVIRGGLGAMLLSRSWKLPFVLSENWTVYYPSDPHFILRRNILFNVVVKNIYKTVNQFLPVTNHLNQRVVNLFGSVPSTIIPNVVDTTLFNYNSQERSERQFRFIHVSTMTYQKNPQGLLRAFRAFIETCDKCCLWMVGPHASDVVEFARSIGLHEEHVHFTGSVTYDKVAAYLKTSNALVLFSRYENLPCVILEGLCCGLPILSTNVGGISEVIDDSNGVLIQNEDENELTAAFKRIYSNYDGYKRGEISANASRLFNHTTIGRAINTVYDRLTEIGKM